MHDRHEPRVSQHAEAKRSKVQVAENYDMWPKTVVGEQCSGGETESVLRARCRSLLYPSQGSDFEWQAWSEFLQGLCKEVVRSSDTTTAPLLNQKDPA